MVKTGLMQVALNRYILLYGFALVALLTTVELFAAEKNRRVQDLAYGTVLYAYFQQDYFQALSELLVAEKSDSLDHHKEFAKVFRGGIHLSYGMDKEAERLFYEIIEGQNPADDVTPPSDLNNSHSPALLGKSKRASKENIARAWFYLGKLLYKKGDYHSAGEKFSKVDKYLTRSLRPEYAFLNATAKQRISALPTSGMPEQQSQPVEDYSPRVHAYNSWAFYKDYNRLLTQLSQNDEQAENRRKRLKIADEMLLLAQRISDSRQINEADELMSLQDQIHTSAGFLFLQMGKHKRAIKSFKQVRQDSTLVGQALLGYGWAAAEAGKYKKALIPWQQLARRSMLEVSTHEALLAVPYAYEKMGANAAALESYDQAADTLMNELQLLASIDEDLQTVSSQRLSQYFNNNAVLWLDESYHNVESPDDSEGAARKSLREDLLHNRMTGLLAQNHYNYLEKQRQDVQWLRQALANWQLDLETIGFVVEARQQRSAVSVSEEARQAIENRYRELADKREKLFELSLRAKGGGPEHVSYLMRSDEKIIQRRIEHAESTVANIQQTLNRLKTNQETGDRLNAVVDEKQFAINQQKVALAKGVLQWQMSNDSTHRQWQVTKALRQIDEQLATAKEALSGLDGLAKTSRLQAEEQAATEEIQQRVGRQQQQAQQLAAQIDQQLIALLKQDVKHLTEQTVIYLAQSRLARARLLDTLSEQNSPAAESKSAERKTAKSKVAKSKVAQEVAI